MSDVARVITPERRRFFELWRKCSFNPELRDACLREAGYRPSTIKAMGKKIAASVQEVIVREMDRRPGLSIRGIVDKHVQLLDAKHPKYKDQPDSPTQIKALEMAYKIRGGFPDPRIQIDERKEISISISATTLRAAEAASGERIIDVIPEEAFEEESEARTNKLLASFEDEPRDVGDSI